MWRQPKIGCRGAAEKRLTLRYLWLLKVDFPSSAGCDLFTCDRSGLALSVHLISPSLPSNRWVELTRWLRMQLTWAGWAALLKSFTGSSPLCHAGWLMERLVSLLILHAHNRSLIHWRSSALSWNLWEDSVTADREVDVWLSDEVMTPACSLSLCLSGVRYSLQTVLMWWFWKCCCSRLYADGCCTGRRNSSNDTNEHHELNLKLQLPSLHTVQVYPARLLLSSLYHICLCSWSMLICVLSHTPKDDRNSCNINQSQFFTAAFKNSQNMCFWCHSLDQLKPSVASLPLAPPSWVTWRGKCPFASIVLTQCLQICCNFHK